MAEKVARGCGASARCVAWFFMAREEDPRLADHNGILVTPFPGASATTIERLVVEPLEEELAQVDKVKLVRATACAGVAILRIELKGAVTDTDAAWDEVEDAIAEALKTLPSGVLPSELTKRIIVDQDAMVYAVTGNADPIALRDAALTLNEALIHVPGVSEVNLEADPGEQITLQYDDMLAKRLGISAGELARQLGQRTQTIPGGSARHAGRAFTIDPNAELDSLEELAGTPVALPSGAFVPLAQIASVRYGAVEPQTELMRLNGLRAVAVSVVPEESLDIVRLGREVLVTPTLSEVTLRPARSGSRLRVSGLARRAADVATRSPWRVGLFALVGIVVNNAIDS